MVTVRLSILFITMNLILCGNIPIRVQTPVHTRKIEILPADSTSNEKTNTPVITYKLIPATNKTWGYDILVDNRLKIHQPSIPALPGNEGFKTKEKAERVARMVIKKMKNGESLPTITTDELKKLNVL